MNHLQIKYEKEITELIDASHRLAELGYVTSAGGNLSLRTEDDLILITPTKTPKRLVRFEDICIVNLNGATVFAPEGKKPTGETPFHVRIMNKRPDIRSVVHAHPPVLTGFAIAEPSLLAQPVLPEPVLEVGPLLMVPYETPISEALSLQFDQVIEDSNGFLMENHGALMCSPNGAADGVEMMQMMECMAQSVVIAKLLGNFKPIPEKAVAELDTVIRKRTLPVPGKAGKFHSVSKLYAHTVKTSSK